MGRSALIGPLLVAGSIASPQVARYYNTTGSVASLSSTISSSLSSSTTTPLSFSSGSLSALSSSSSSRSSLIEAPGLSPSTTPSAIITTNLNSTTLTPSQSLPIPSSSFPGNSSLATPSISAGNATTTGLCTGCVIQAYEPVTTSYDDEDTYNPWTSIVVTETILTSYITYLDGTTIDGVATEIQTVNQTKTLVLSGHEIITHTTPVFTIMPTPGVTLTVDAGPTYLIYNNLYGALDHFVNTAYPDMGITLNTCVAEPTRLRNWEPSEKSDWDYFIQTYTNSAPTPSQMNYPVQLPSNALHYLQNNLAILSQYHGSNIATCTTRPTTGVARGTSAHLPAIPPPPERTTEPASSNGVETRTETANVPVGTFLPPFMSIPTSTFLSTTYDSTSTHVTRLGCLRCDMTISNRNVPDNPTPPANIVQPSYTPINPPSSPDDKPIHQEPPQRDPDPGQSINIGNSVVVVKPAEQTPDPGRPNEQNQARPGIIVGSDTLMQGQSTVINGVLVVVPLDGSGPNIVIGGTTIPVNSAPTTALVLAVGQNVITPNPQGQFVVGTQTLSPGGPIVIVDGNTMSLGPNNNIAVVNGITQTLANGPVMTPPPVLTIGGQTITAALVGGSTQFVLGGQILAPGNAITVGGITYSVPSDGQGQIVVNGVTSTLSPGQNVLTLGQQVVAATVTGGATAFIFGPGQTLTPGGVLTISQTTLSMPASGSGSVIVINGVTSTLGQGPVTAGAALTVDGKTYSATVRDGTTEFVLGQGTTLRPSEAVTISGTTYSLDAAGTALVINGQTSTIPRVPASIRASTTVSSSRNAGDYVGGGISGKGGGATRSTSKGGAGQIHPVGFDKWVESLVIAAAGWLMVVL